MLPAETERYAKRSTALAGRGLERRPLPSREAGRADSRNPRKNGLMVNAWIHHHCELEILLLQRSRTAFFIALPSAVLKASILLLSSPPSAEMNRLNRPL
jgi:hypothetical protein